MEIDPDVVKLRPRDIKIVVKRHIQAREPVIIKGPPGTGKTEVLFQIIEGLAQRKVYTSCGTSDRTAAEGMPWVFPEHKRAEFFPFGQLADVLAAKHPTVWVWDDIGWMESMSTQNAWCHLVHERITPNGDRLPDWVTIVATTNERHQKTGVGAFSDAFKTRFDAIYEMEPHLDDSCDWFNNNYPDVPEVPMYLRECPEDLNDVKSATTDLTNRATPRTWASAARKLRLKLPPHLEYAALTGAIGKGMASKFLGVLPMMKAMASVDMILADPDGVPLPKDITDASGREFKKTSALWGTAVGLSKRATVNNFARVCRYAERLDEDGSGEFATLMIRKATERDPKLGNTAAYMKLMCGPLGKLITGDGE